MDFPKILRDFAGHLKAYNGLTEMEPELSLEALFQRPATNDSLQTRFEAYGDGYPSRLYDGLKEVYPTIEKLLGHDQFYVMTMRFIQCCPSKTYSLDFVGLELPEFLEAANLFPEIPFLVDLAKLERAAFQSFHRHFQRGESSPDTFSEISRVRLQETTCLLWSRWTLGPLWRAFLKGETLPEVSEESEHKGLLVYRDNEVVRVTGIESNEGLALEQFQKSHTLSDWMDRCYEKSLFGDSPESTLKSWFERWQGLQILVSSTN